MIRSATGMTAIGLVLGAVLLFVSVNVAVRSPVRRRAHLDLTRSAALHALSDGTKAILGKIGEPITLKLYYSKHLGEVSPGYAVFAERVEDLLQEYVARSATARSSCRSSTRWPISDIEDQATAAGLQGVPLRREWRAGLFRPWSRPTRPDDQDTIPFLQSDREKFLEYDLTKLIQALAFPKRKVIGLATALPLDGDMMAPDAGEGRPIRS